ncbi:ABC transporter permease, partial [Methylobacterium sp. CCH7-A2]
MLKYILKRILVMIPTLLVTSALIFTVINLPEGDYFETLAAEMQAQGEKADLSRIEFLKQEYGFDRPVIERYFWWVTGLLQGDMGYSFEYQRPVREVVGDRLLLTMIVSFVTIIFTWVVAFPIGIYSATHQYSWGDY